MTRGLARTARVITAAAAIMVFVFLSVLLVGMIEVKQFGLGLGVAVLIDATLVRMVLVPAVMELLGAVELVAARLARPAPARGRASRGAGGGGAAGAGRRVGRSVNGDAVEEDLDVVVGQALRV